MSLAVDARSAAPAALEERFARARQGPSDICEHLERLREYASRCEHATEFGIRWATGATVALLAGQPATLVSWDLEPAFVVAPAVADLLACAGRTRFQPRVGDSRLVTIEPTELLVLDTVHTHGHLLAELGQHAVRVARWIVLHDTATFGETGEDGSTPGLRRAIDDFLAWPANRWIVRERVTHNNGLTVLERTR